MKAIPVLPYEAEAFIREFICQKLKSEDIYASYPEQLLREDTLELLDRFCTVVFYPLKDEENNGFHVSIPFKDGHEQDFVFINTAQTMEKQTFTAAHELGHIWKADEAILHALGLENTVQHHEAAINRFAATLLMPEEQFKTVLAIELRKLCNEDRSISVFNMYKLIVILMNYFCAPMKSVVLRMCELKCLNQTDTDLLLGTDKKTESEISDLINNLVSDFGFIKLQKTLYRKHIKGLSDLLDAAERNQALPQEKIDHIREEFELNPPVQTGMELDKEISLTS